MDKSTKRAKPGGGLQVVMEHTFRVPRPRVFRAWTDPALMEKWFAPAGMQAVGVQADVAVGGSYRIGMRGPDGIVNVVAGKYVEILPPERLVFTWAWQTDPPEAVSLVTVEFFDLGDATRVVLKHRQLPTPQDQESHRRGWEGCLAQLENKIQGGDI